MDFQCSIIREEDCLDQVFIFPWNCSSSRSLYQHIPKTVLINKDPRRRVIGWLSWTASPYQMAEPISINKSGVLMRMWGDVGDLGIMYPAKRPRITNTCSSMLEKRTGEERNSS